MPPATSVPSSTAHALLPARIDLPEAPIRGMNLLWKRRSSDDEATSLPLITRILRARGIASDAESIRFLDPRLSDLHDPSLLPGADAAADRLMRALRAAEPIVIYGDYDVDGVTASAILYHTLHAVASEIGATPDIRTYVPHRLEEGYGLNTEAITELASAGARVIVSVDCGVTAFEPAREARRCGVDLIITDHHSLPSGDAGLPDAFAVVHPRLPGSRYPFGELCGAGVAFKLAWKLASIASGGGKSTPRLRQMLLELLTLTSLGVIADVVPLLDENRIIARHGLSQIRRSKLAGLRELVVASGLEGENVGEYDVGFKLGPRLNASGRMGHAREAVELFTTAQGERAAAIAADLTRQNDLRRKTQDLIFQQALQMAEEQGMTGTERRAIVLAHPQWHAGVVGIVCSKLVEKFHRPTLLLAMTDGHCHGSGRSVDGFDLHHALDSCSSHLTTFGGHAMAAGVRVAHDRLPAFVEAFCEFANARIPPEDLCGRVTYDCTASVHEINLPLIHDIQRLAPFGRCNPQVELRIERAVVSRRAEVMGKNSKHLSFCVSEPGGRHMLRIVAWNWGAMVDRFPVGRDMQMVVSPKHSEWNGISRAEAELVDVKFESSDYHSA